MRPPPPLLTAALLSAVLAAGVCAGGLSAWAEPPKGGVAPDPPPRASKKQWLVEVAAQGGKVAADRARAQLLDQPAESARVMGRFALELWVGRELLDRVRFNVPLMGDEAPEGNRNRLPRPRFDKSVSTRVTVRIADNPRASYAVLHDRETGAAQKLSWPPEADGRLVPWSNGLTEGKEGDFPDGGVRAVGHRDAGAADGGAPAVPPDAGPSDAGRR
jgi:hypothetical protein